MLLVYSISVARPMTVVLLDRETHDFGGNVYECHTISNMACGYVHFISIFSATLGRFDFFLQMFTLYNEHIMCPTRDKPGVQVLEHRMTS